MKTPLSPKAGPDLDRRGFLKLSCATAVAAAVTLPSLPAPGTACAQVEASRRAAPSDRPNLYGRWFAV